jgi:hypothetical protein
MDDVRQATKGLTDFLLGGRQGDAEFLVIVHKNVL